MAVTAKKLSRSGVRSREIDTVVRDQLAIIDTALTRAPRSWGRNTVTVDLPIDLKFAGLSTQDSQRIVYGSILRSLDRRGFEHRILLEDTRTCLIIAWNVDITEEEIEALNAIIRARRIASAEVPKFIRRSGMTKESTSVPMRVTDKGRVMMPRGGVTAPPRPGEKSRSERELLGPQLSSLLP